MIKIFRHFAETGNTDRDADLVIAAEKTIVIKAIDFSGPQAMSSMKVVKNPATDNEILSSANGDKFVGELPSIPLEGPITLRCTLSKGGGGPSVLMGIIIYYEEFG